jgi:hypothetical protein
MKRDNEEQLPEKINPDELAKIGEVITDPETGIQVQVTREAVSQMLQAETQISNSMSVLAMSLKTIRDNKYYLFRGCDSFKEYTERFLMYSPRHTQRLLSIADSFCDSEHFNDIASLPHRFLEQVRKDAAKADQLKNGEYTDSEGNVITLDELKEMSNAELTNEVRQLKAKTKNLKQDVTKFKLESEENKKLADELEQLAGGERIRAIKDKREILSTLMSARGSMSVTIQELNNIETEDPEIINEFSGVITGAITALSALQDKYFHHLLSAGNK